MGRATPFAERWLRVGAWSGFTLCGLAGVLLGTTASAALAVVVGRPWWLAPVLAAAMAVGFVTVAAVDGFVAGRTRLVCFHDEAGALLVAVAALVFTTQPVPASLDVAAPGLALFLACGRVGCLVAGCCHGLPAAHGITYGSGHADEGLAPELVGVRLLPVAGLEAGALVAVAAVTAGVALSSAAPGTALVVLLVAQVAVRFGLETARGDDRRVRAGLSEAQWTACAVTGGLLVAGAVGWDAVPLPLVGVVAVVLAAAAVLLATSSVPPLRAPGHVRELARVVHGAEAAQGQLVVATTTRGVRMSATSRAVGDHLVRHYAFSRSHRPLARDELAALERVMRGLGPRAQVTARHTSAAGVHHVVLATSGLATSGPGPS